MNNISYFEIQSSHPERDICFYEAVFGWKFNKAAFAPVEYYTIQTNGINGGLLKRPAPVPPAGSGTNAFVCSIEVENLNKTSELILQRGGQIALPKFPVPGKCWQAYFLDLDNNTFGVFEADENAK